MKNKKHSVVTPPANTTITVKSNIDPEVQIQIDESEIAAYSNYIVNELVKTSVLDGQQSQENDPMEYALSVIGACFLVTLNRLLHKSTSDELNSLNKRFEDILNLNRQFINKDLPSND
jgi:hypothetical protein